MKDALGAELRDRIISDLEPVEPLAPGWRRALPTAMWGSFGVFALTFFGSSPSSPGGWYFSAAVCVIGFIALAQCCDEAIPTSGLRPRDIVLLIGGLVGFHAYVMSTGEPEGSLGWSSVWVCWAVLLGIGAPTTIWGVYQAHRGMPGHWWVVGLLAATGSYLIAVGAWHLSSPIHQLSNLLVGHSGALCGLLILGLGYSYWLERRA